jgi:hypothetical protein
MAGGAGMGSVPTTVWRDEGLGSRIERMGPPRLLGPEDDRTDGRARIGG